MVTLHTCANNRLNFALLLDLMKHACVHVYLASFLRRDPIPDATLIAFQNCIKWFLNGDFSEGDITEAKLSVIAQVSTKVPFYNVKVNEKSFG